MNNRTRKRKRHHAPNRTTAPLGAYDRERLRRLVEERTETGVCALTGIRAPRWEGRWRPCRFGRAPGPWCGRPST